MSRTVNVILLIVLIIIFVPTMIVDFRSGEYPRAIFVTGLVIRLVGMLANEYQLKWAKKLSYTGLVIAAVGAIYALYAYFM